jgi:Ca2+-binding EF-hand superfamily protein
MSRAFSSAGYSAAQDCGEPPASLKAWMWTVETLEKKMFEKLIERNARDRTFKTFQLFDATRKGFVTVGDIMRAYKKYDLYVDEEQGAEIFNIMNGMDSEDADTDGRIFYPAFQEYMAKADHYQPEIGQKYQAKAYWNAMGKQERSMTTSGFVERIRELPGSLSSSRWTQDVVIKKIQDKIYQYSDNADGRGSHNAFRLFDKYKQGVIKKNHLGAVTSGWGIVLDRRELDSLFEFCDYDGDGVISRDDFAKRIMPQEFRKAACKKGFSYLARPLTETQSLVNVTSLEEPVDDVRARRSYGKTLKKKESWISTGGFTSHPVTAGPPGCEKAAAGVVLEEIETPRQWAEYRSSTNLNESNCHSNLNDSNANDTFYRGFYNSRKGSFDAAHGRQRFAMYNNQNAPASPFPSEMRYDHDHSQALENSRHGRRESGKSMDSCQYTR